MKTLLTILSILISGLLISQNSNIKFMNDTQLPKSVVIQESPKIPMSAYQFNIKDDKHTTKVAAITGYILLNSFAITTHCIMTNSKNTLQTKKPSPTGLIMTTVGSTILLGFVLTL
jgi:hypothetical protein